MPKMTIVEAIAAAEEAAGRKLRTDEYAVLGQLVQAGKETEDVRRMFENEPEPRQIKDEDIPVRRYEAVGMDRVVEITGIPPAEE